ncbi:MAG: glycosyltransferase [Cytophagales bacterium]|nr:glycosyltransferase [Cytophagales bacterium]
MELSVIIPTKDRGDVFFRTLRSVYDAVRDVAAEIIVVNDSKTGTVGLPPAYAPRVTVLDNPKSGVASARNLGAAQARGRLLLFLDDDMLVSPENVRVTLQLHRQFSHCCINLNWIYPPELTDTIRREPFGRYLIHYGFTSLEGWNRGDRWDPANLFRTEGITSQYLSMERDVFRDSGGYTEGFPHAGFEDFDFAKKLKKQGVAFYIYPLSVAFHNETDRLSLPAWLARKERGGETRRVAVAMGHQELALHYGPLKKTAFTGITWATPLLARLLRRVPDALYFRIVNVLLATAIFKGYTKRA